MCTYLYFRPDQKSEVLCDYVYQLLCGKEKPVHCVAYDCANEQANVSIHH